MCSMGQYSDPGVTMRTAVHSGGKRARKENATTAAANLFWRPVIGRTSCPTTKFIQVRNIPQIGRAGNIRVLRDLH